MLGSCNNKGLVCHQHQSTASETTPTLIFHNTICFFNLILIRLKVTDYKRIGVKFKTLPRTDSGLAGLGMEQNTDSHKETKKKDKAIMSLSNPGSSQTIVTLKLNMRIALITRCAMQQKILTVKFAVCLGDISQLYQYKNS